MAQLLFTSTFLLARLLTSDQKFETSLMNEYDYLWTKEELREAQYQRLAAKMEASVK